MLDDRQLAALAHIAVGAVRATVAAESARHERATARDPRLDEPGASFVTLRRDGALRGCIGTLEAWRALSDDVAANARAAAVQDPRFSPLAAAELDVTVLEVSVLTPAAALAVADDDELYATLQPGIDGLVIAHGSRRATYLPSVWDQIPEPRRFVAELRRKAGIDAALPISALSLARYRTQHSPALPLGG